MSTVDHLTRELAEFGVPVQLGKTGIEKIIELKLTDDELKQLQASANHVAESVGKLKL